MEWCGVLAAIRAHVAAARPLKYWLITKYLLYETEVFLDVAVVGSDIRCKCQCAGL